MGRVVIIGSGLAGLTTAIRLGSSGHQIVVFEQGAEPGGSLGRVSLGNDYFDAEPGYWYLTQVLADLFAVSGHRLDDFLDFLPLRPATRFHFPDGEHFDFFTDEDRLRKEIERIHPPDLRSLDRFFRYTRGAFHGLNKGPWRRPAVAGFDALAGMLHPSAILRLPRLLTPRTAQGMADHLWKHPNLRRAFGSMATELGASPIHAPAAALWSAFVLLRFGAWYPRGGMGGLRRALLRLVETLGIEIRCDTPVESLVVQGDRVRGVVTRDGRSIEASAVVLAVDPRHFTADLSKHESFRVRFFQRRFSRREPSFSRFAFFWNVKANYPDLAHRTVLLPQNQKSEYQPLREWGVSPVEPTIHLVHPARTDPDIASSGQTALTAWCFAPGISSRWRWDDTQRAAFRTAILERLDAIGLQGIRIAIQEERELPPSTWKESFGRSRGASFGAGSNGLFDLVVRHPNRYPGLQRLYCSGRWAHPGPTPPQVVLGGRLVAQLIQRDLGID